MKKVLFRAPVLTSSGYGVHGRQVLKWLKSQEELGLIDLTVQVLPWGDTTWYINSEDKDGLIGYAMSKTRQLEKSYDVTYQLQLPNEWDSNLGIVNIGITAGVESDICPTSWIECCNKMSLVVVPSEFTKNCFETTSKRYDISLLTEIKVIPESYIESIDLLSDEIKKEDNLDLGLKETDYAVLVHGQLTSTNHFGDRKNTFNTIKWLCDLYKNDENFVILVKTNMSRNSKIDRMMVKNLLTELSRHIRNGKYPRIKLLHGDLSDLESAKLYRHPSIKCLVSLTRGEGFGLPLLEAAASELPVIATNWSAHTEYLKDEFIKIDSRLVNVHQSRIDNKIFVKDSMWAEPSEFDFKSKMKKFRECVVSVDTKKLKDRIKNEYQFNKIAKKYSEIESLTNKCFIFNLNG